ncbi:MAG: GreA/GreB family elongation factor [Halomonas sp.]|uniref:GreA/GreB family elongation factor n=1 Tax=Halomonas sp. TaxID=1486246 RepID=UPI0017AABD61|nr:GreA/GreB family elongation factor [Halomonas sp.]NWN84054.1 GreA/GreB family elongation factor [Halomonas sp.]
MIYANRSVGKIFSKGMCHPFFFRGRPVDYASVVEKIEELAAGAGGDPSVASIDKMIRIVDLSTGERRTYTLTEPGKSNPRRGLVSIFSPLGAALLSSKVGEVVKVVMMGFEKEVRIIEVQ